MPKVGLFTNFFSKIQFLNSYLASKVLNELPYPELAPLEPDFLFKIFKEKSLICTGQKSNSQYFQNRSLQLFLFLEIALNLIVKDQNILKSDNKKSSS